MISDDQISVRGGSNSGGSSGEPIGTINISFEDYTCYHLAIAYSSSEEKIYFYRDGNYLGESSFGEYATNGTNSLWIGNSLTIGSHLSFEGSIDEVRIWDDVRTPNEISENSQEDLLNVINGTENLIGYYKFDSDEGQIITDYSGNSLHGTLGRTSEIESLYDPEWKQDDLCFSTVYQFDIDATSSSCGNYEFAVTPVNPNTTYTWEINGMSILATDPNINYFFTDIGSYTVSAIVTNSCGGTTQETIQVDVNCSFTCDNDNIIGLYSAGGNNDVINKFGVLSDVILDSYNQCSGCLNLKGNASTVDQENGVFYWINITNGNHVLHSFNLNNATFETIPTSFSFNDVNFIFFNERDEYLYLVKNTMAISSGDIQLVRINPISGELDNDFNITVPLDLSLGNITGGDLDPIQNTIGILFNSKFISFDITNSSSETKSFPGNGNNYYLSSLVKNPLNGEYYSNFVSETADPKNYDLVRFDNMNTSNPTFTTIAADYVTPGKKPRNLTIDYQRNLVFSYADDICGSEDLITIDVNNLTTNCNTMDYGSGPALIFEYINCFINGEPSGLRYSVDECNMNGTFELSTNTTQEGATIQWTYGGGHYGQFIFDGQAQDTFDITTLPPTFTLPNGGSAVVLPSGLIEAQVVMTPASSGWHEYCFVSYNSDHSCIDTVCQDIYICGKAVEFDGVNDQVKIPHGGALNVGTQPFAIEMQIETNSNKNNMLLLTNNVTSNTYALDGIFVGLENGQLYVNIFKNAFTNHFLKDTDGVDLRDGQCHHVAISRSAEDILKLYIDGNEVESGSIASNINMSYGQNFFLGNTNMNGSSLDYNGIIDELRVWTVERTSTEIFNNKNTALLSNPAGLGGWWRFDESVDGQTFQDLSGNGRDAFLGHSANTEGMDASWVDFCCMATNNIPLRLANTPTIIDKNKLLIKALDFKVYPNPFNKQLNFDFYLEEETLVSIKLFNSIGQEVANVVDNEMKSTGNHQIQFNNHKLTSGLYFYQIKLGDQIISDQIILQE